MSVRIVGVASAVFAEMSHRNVCMPLSGPSRESTSVSPPPVPVSAFAEIDANNEAATPFGDSAREGASSENSFAESHRTSRGWIAECLWWLASCRRPRVQSDYIVLFVNGSDRFGSNSCRLSGTLERESLSRRGVAVSFVKRDLANANRNRPVMSEGRVSPSGVFCEYDTDDSPVQSSRSELSTWQSRTRKSLWEYLCCKRRGLPRAVSGYEVLIRDGSSILGSNVLPLSDPRLKPRLPKLLILFLVLLSLGGILCVFFLVPRGVSLLDPVITVNNFEISNTNQSFHLVVDLMLPFKNPNYVAVHLTGQVNMTYYDALADSQTLNVTLSRRDTTPANVTLDSSGLTLKYISTAIMHCYSFPSQEVFFMSGSFKAQYLLQKQHLSVDTYEFFPCPISNLRHTVGAV